jgi:hypothetical protein
VTNIVDDSMDDFGRPDAEAMSSQNHSELKVLLRPNVQVDIESLDY